MFALSLYSKSPGLVLTSKEEPITINFDAEHKAEDIILKVLSVPNSRAEIKVGAQLSKTANYPIRVGMLIILI